MNRPRASTVAGARVLHQLIDGIRDDLGCGVLLISHDLQIEHQQGNQTGGYEDADHQVDLENQC